jgi:hypothetical protein
MTTTTNFADFGYREREMAEELLKASRVQGFPEDFYVDEVTIMMNMNSGNVFFTNSDFQVAMMNGDDLESFYSCPICGHEGFADEMAHNEGDEECQEYLKDACIAA